MQTKFRRLSLMLFGFVFLGFVSLAHAADVEARVAAYNTSIQELVGILSGVKDLASSKAALPKLNAAVQKHNTATDAVYAEFKKLKLSDPKDGAIMEKALAELQKANVQLATERMRLLSTKNAGGEVIHRALEGIKPPPKLF